MEVGLRINRFQTKTLPRAARLHHTRITAGTTLRRASPSSNSESDFCSFSSCLLPIATTKRPNREAILVQRLKAHDAAVTATLVTQDKANGKKELITSSLDKKLVLWSLKENEGESGSHFEELVRLEPAGAPIFSLAEDGSKALGESHNQVFCGNRTREIVAWEPPDLELQKKVVLNGHTGWVRALATHDRWLFSCSCNYLRQWDMARAVPRHVRDIKLFTGDILGLCTGAGRLYSCGADGSIRSWKISKKGELVESVAREKAHSDRVTAVLWNNNFLYSVSYDGSVKMWDAETLELVMEVQNAHKGERIHCAAVGPDGFLYTGADDKLVRRWKLGLLTPAASDALFCHNYSVRSIAAGPDEMLVSGDAGGEVAVWVV